MISSFQDDTTRTRRWTANFTRYRILTDDPRRPFRPTISTRTHFWVRDLFATRRHVRRKIYWYSASAYARGADFVGSMPDRRLLTRDRRRWSSSAKDNRCCGRRATWRTICSVKFALFRTMRRVIGARNLNLIWHIRTCHWCLYGLSTCDWIFSLFACLR